MKKGNQLRVSFDFDDTLEHPWIQDYARKLVSRGIDVWIVTTRWNRLSKYYSPQYYKTHGNTWRQVHLVALDLGIPLKQVVFTCYEYKAKFFHIERDFIWHLDDNPMEFKKIEKLGIVPIDSLSSNWEEKCEELLWKSILEKGINI